MGFLPSTTYRDYPENEKQKLDSLATLFRDWHRQFSENRTLLKKHEPDHMCFDGFYPHYFEQRKRILFIGWESRGLSECHYIDELLYTYRTTKRFPKQSLNQSLFHSRMLKIAWGINHHFRDGSFPVWDEIPKAAVIGDTFGAPDGISFAFMNLCKLSNEAEGHAADGEVINTAISLSTQPRNFIREEIAILEPDIIIVMNLDNTNFELGSLGRLDLPHQSEATFWCRLDNGSHRSLLIHTWHFAASRRWKDDVADFYNPICDAIRRSDQTSQNAPN